jgi:hypothetical protein
MDASPTLWGRAGFVACLRDRSSLTGFEMPSLKILPSGDACCPRSRYAVEQQSTELIGTSGVRHDSRQEPLAEPTERLRRGKRCGGQQQRAAPLHR